MHRCSRVLLAASSVLFLAGSALAAETHAYPECTMKPSESDVTAAKGAFQAGTVSFNEADYQRAIMYWEDAFRRDCTATLLLHHLGRAYEGAGNLEQAVIALRTYAERAPDSPERAQIQRRIEVFEQKIAADKQALAAQASAAQTQQTQASAAGQNQAAASATQPATATGQHRPFPWAPVAVTAGGGVLAIVGGIVYLSANSDVNNIEKQCGGRNNCPANSNLAQQGNDARSRAQIGAGVFYGGLAVAAGGAVWLVLDSTKKSPQQAEHTKPPALSPWVGGGVAGLAWQGQF